MSWLRSLAFGEEALLEVLLRCIDLQPELPELDSNGRRRSPSLVKVAGISWLIAWSLIILVFSVALVQDVMQTQDPGLLRMWLSCCGFWIVVGAACIQHGVKTVRGTIADPLVTGFCAIVFGAIFDGLVLYSVLFDHLDVQVADRFVLLGGGGLALIVAGILALLGRAEYRAWRKANQANLGKKRLSDGESQP